MAMATLAAWTAWVVVLWSIDPTRASVAGFLFFYASLSLALLGTLTVIGTAIRVWARREELASRHVAKSFRHALLFTVLLVASLLLLSQGFFRWWTVGLVILLLSMIELALISASRPRATGLA
jgi:hypothetical protein